MSSSSCPRTNDERLRWFSSIHSAWSSRMVMFFRLTMYALCALIRMVVAVAWACGPSVKRVCYSCGAKALLLAPFGRSLRKGLSASVQVNWKPVTHSSSTGLLVCLQIHRINLVECFRCDIAQFTGLNMRIPFTNHFLRVIEIPGCNRISERPDKDFPIPRRPPWGRDSHVSDGRCRFPPPLRAAGESIVLHLS